MSFANDNIIWSEIDDEIVLLDTTSGEFYSLNETATEAWRALERGESVAQLVADLSGKYGIDPRQAHTDVLELIAELRGMGLLSSRREDAMAVMDGRE